jgi:hypothetical protein
MISHLFSDSNFIIINISWSKTIQFGERNLVVPLINIPDSPLCPVKAYHNMFLLIKKNAYKDKHQKVASQASVTSSFL